VVKNKVSPPFAAVDFDIMYGAGISKEGEILDIAVKFNIIDKAGSWFAYNNEKIGQGRENVKAYLQARPEILNQIEQLIRKKATTTVGADFVVAQAGLDNNLDNLTEGE
jgi:recombination protein RecA